MNLFLSVLKKSRELPGLFRNMESELCHDAGGINLCKLNTNFYVE